MSIKEHLETICRYREWAIHMDPSSGNATIDITTPSGNQRRIIMFRRVDPSGGVSNFFCTDVCPQSEIKDPGRILKENGFMNHGAFAIMNERLIVMDTQVEDTADIEEVAAIITHLSSYAERFSNM